MWFVISVIYNLPKKKKVYAVYTSYLDKSNKHFWNGFGPANSSELQHCFDERVLLSDADLRFGQELWMAYKDNKPEELSRLAEKSSVSFPYLKEVVQAQVDRFPKDGSNGRPEKVIEEILKSGSTDFHEVFKEFWKRESIYGFGDTQLKQIYEKIMQSRQ